MYEYKIISKWAGWFGGFGSERDISAMINAEAVEGWRLVRSENGIFFWWYLPWFPRRRLLLFFERPALAAAGRTAGEATPANATPPAYTPVSKNPEGPFVQVRSAFLVAVLLIAAMSFACSSNSDSNPRSPATTEATTATDLGLRPTDTVEPAATDAPAPTSAPTDPPGAGENITEPTRVPPPVPTQPSVESNCDASYPDFCIPRYPPDLDCADIIGARFTVLPPDPHGFDRDNDGIGCESN